MTLRLPAAALFWAILSVWTWLLLRPHPIPDVVDTIPLGWRFFAAKSLHAGTYATLTVLGLVWQATRRGRSAVVVLILAHGIGTEIAQTFVPSREGCVRDVAVDWAGVLLGVTIVQSFVRYCRTRGPVLPTSGAN